MVDGCQRREGIGEGGGRVKTPITVKDVLNSRMIAYPFCLLPCLVTDGGGALILVAAEPARDFPQRPV
jgi:hypothetical protein